VNVLDLFSGIGGFSLGFERAGLKTLAFVESDDACVAHLARRWPHIPVFGDVRLLTVEPGFCDVLCGGFPCQPFSTASRGRKTAVDLWPEFLRIIRLAAPRWVVAENVPGIADDGVERVCGDLESAGYAVWPFNVDTALPARQRGRHRIIWLAHSNDALHDRFAVDAEVARVREVSGLRWPNDSPPVGMDDELPGRMDRFRQLGNAVTPYFAEIIGRTIMRASAGLVVK
jgi:DNA (cytosine-5)-methyltransferase 1